MRRHELEHILRASASVTGAQEIVVIGSQAILGSFPWAPEELLVSREADVFTFRDPLDAEKIDGAIGERTTFHETFGYYAHGVAEETATLPAGWKERLVRVQNENTGGAAGLCLEANDLAVSKLVAGREKDLNFVRAMLRRQLADVGIVSQRLESVRLDAERIELVKARLLRLTQG